MGANTEVLVAVHPLLAAAVDSTIVVTIDEHCAAVDVDDQFDFDDPQGSLYAFGAERKREAAAEFLLKFAPQNRITTGDDHSADHYNAIENGGRWPAHCVHDTTGAELSPALKNIEIGKHIRKGFEKDVESYGAAFDEKGHSNGLIEYLNEIEANTVFVFRLVLEFCVGTTALQLADTGFDVYVVADLTTTIGIEEGPDSIALMVERLKEAGVKFIYSSQVH